MDRALAEERRLVVLLEAVLPVPVEAEVLVAERAADRASPVAVLLEARAARAAAGRALPAAVLLEVAVHRRPDVVVLVVKVGVAQGVLLGAVAVAVGRLSVVVDAVVARILKSSSPQP